MCGVHMLIIKKRQKIYVPDNLAILSSWKIIAPVVAEEIRISDYTPVPYCFDTNAYKLGYIFAPINTKITCLGSVPILKVLGPIRNFVIENETCLKWLDKDFYSVRSTGDQVDFQIILTHGRDTLSFAGYNYYILSKPKDMPTVGNVTINRAAHEDLYDTRWIGLITSVVVTKVFEINAIKDLRERKFSVGDDIHTIFFKYEICNIDDSGTIVNSARRTFDVDNAFVMEQKIPGVSP
ncbi:hypothetical protein HN011_000076 [Eciton burchellii]|nr:hypothetical protein HN011_000076 [Eciton burchellii]